MTDKTIRDEMNESPITSANLIILGRNVGTHTGWDSLDERTIVFTGVIPNAMLTEALAPRYAGVYPIELVVDLEHGTMWIQDEKSGAAICDQLDLVNALMGMPRDSSLISLDEVNRNNAT